MSSSSMWLGPLPARIIENSTIPALITENLIITVLITEKLTRES